MMDHAITRGRLVLAATALVLAVAAPLAGSPFVHRNARIDVTQLASAVQRQEDHITAVELAQWIRERRPGLRIIDVRSAEDFEAYHVPTAERAPLDSVIVLPFRADETIVLYSEGGAHAAQAWVLLRALGHDRVFFLRDGLHEWLDDVMNPTIADDASPRERADFQKISEISKYFGGHPRTGLARGPGYVIPINGGARDSASTKSMVRALRGRGC